MCYAFDDLKMNWVEIMVVPGNTRSRPIPRHLGFTQEGVLRQVLLRHDRFLDPVVYGMLAGEWQARIEYGKGDQT